MNLSPRAYILNRRRQIYYALKMTYNINWVCREFSVTPEFVLKQVTKIYSNMNELKAMNNIVDIAKDMSLRNELIYKI